MRRVLSGLSCVLPGLLGCTSSDGAPKPSDGVLILEVGGEQPSLREALAAHGVIVAPARLLRPEDPAPVSSGEESPPEPDEPPPKSQSKPVAPPEPAESFVVVKLARGQTLIHLAKKHLGDGNRFRDILALNGWTEADARRLRENQDVKIPRATKTGEPSGGR
ncbi:MAG TPA: hypothetical protein VFD82_01710 [Planctomycetota bacterium]|nr:hypothetical protein [Planctomycetota bacterium]